MHSCAWRKKFVEAGRRCIEKVKRRRGKLAKEMKRRNWLPSQKRKRSSGVRTNLLALMPYRGTMAMPLAAEKLGRWLNTCLKKLDIVLAGGFAALDLKH